MPAKNKSIQTTDEPVIVEEVQSEDTEQISSSDQSTTTDTTSSPAGAPLSGDAAELSSDTAPPSGATETPAEPNISAADSPDSAPETEKQPEMEQHETEQDTLAPIKSGQASQPNDFFGAPPEEAKGGIPKALIAVALLVVAGGAAAFMFVGGPGKFLGASVEATPTPNTEEIPAPMPSPEAEDVDLTEFTVRVLNGTGTAGEAGKVKALLEEAGFEDIKTGNAPSEDNTVTTVSTKADVPAGAVKAVENALKGVFTTEAGDALDEDSDYDIVVTTGGASAKDATGSAEGEE